MRLEIQSLDLRQEVSRLESICRQMRIPLYSE